MAGTFSNLDHFATLFARDDPRDGDYNDGGVLPAPPGVTPNFADPLSKKNQLAVPNYVLYTIAMIFVILRMCVRAFINRSLGWDDYFALLAMALVTAHFVAITQLLEYGMGNHLWEITVSAFSSGYFAQWDVAQLMIYLAASFSVKIAVLLLYLRLFSVSIFLRRTIYGIGIFVTLVFLSGELSVIFACTPVRRIWDLSVPGTCVSITDEVIAQGFLAVFTDTMIVAIPIRTVWLLALPMKTKLAVMAIFTVGVFVCGVSAARVGSILYVTNKYSSSDLEYYDTTWYGMDGYVWGVIEINLALIGCCAPTLRPIYSKFIPWLRQKSYLSFRRSSSTQPSSRKSESEKQVQDSLKSSEQSDGDDRLVKGSMMELGEEGKNETMVTAAASNPERHLDSNNITKTISVDVKGEES